MKRFVILRHETPAGYARPLHWDLMLEAEGVLRAWALAEEPGAGEAIEAEALADHRLEYLDYEGPVSQGRGAVTRWDAGEYRLLEETPGRLTVALEGARLRGVVVLEAMDGAGEAPPQCWRFSPSLGRT